MPPPKSLKKKLYVGCAINNLPAEKRDQFLKMITDLKEKLRERFHVLEFMSAVKENPSAKEIYDRDIVECVAEADYMLAICDYASLGLGYEMATAIEKYDTPVLAMAHRDANVSKLILGIHGHKYCFLRYESIEEIAEKVASMFLFSEQIS